MFKMLSNLDKIVQEKKIEIVYPKGYISWKKHFDKSISKTKNVSKTLDEIHGYKPKKEK